MEFFAGLVVGVLGSIHCAGMCGPLALALPVPQASRARFITGRLMYNLGRIVTYGLLGALAGLIGERLFAAGAQQTVSIILGVILLLAAVAPVLLKRIRVGALLLEHVTAPVQYAIGTLLRRSSVFAMFLLGLVNGLLPCGLVYVALAAALTTGGTLLGVVFMLGFGVGTAPVMFLIALLGKQIQGGLRKRLTALMPVFAAAIAVLIILRGMNLGIPYISPKVMVEQGEEQKSGTCH